MAEERAFKRFGKYLILDHLVDGGMAEISRARFLAEKADKIVAIKMVQPQFSSDPQFKRMFMDEIQVSFGLIHPNIAQTYEYGLHEERLYVAMEYVDGKNLKEFLDRLKKRKFVFPVEISVYLASQICQGLSYAHTFTDKLSGKDANIIHRDISPHNIMVTYDGAVKVIDFGIAKAETNSEATQAGTIKGKLSYLAPEYLDGMDLDHRYDQFAVGITIWELLCSRKLFDAPNDLACLKKIQACKVPVPSSINPNVPKELDQIVLKALSKDRNLRYENMDQFNRALVKFLYATYPDFNATDLGYFAGELFKEEIDKDKTKFLEYGKLDIRPYLDDLKKEQSSGESGSAASSSSSADGVKRQPRIEIDMEMSEQDIQEATSTIQLDKVGLTGRSQTGIRKSPLPPPPGAKTQVRQRSAGTVVAKNAGTRTGMRPGPAGGSQTRMTQTSAKVQTKKSSPVKFLLILVVLFAAGYMKSDLVKQYTGFDPKGFVDGQLGGGISPTNNTKPPVAEVEEEAIISGTLILSGTDFYMEIYIDNKKIKYGGVGHTLSLGRHTLKIIKENHRPYISEFEISKESPSTTISVPALKKAKYGALSSSRNFSSGFQIVINVDGQRIEKTLPIRRLQLPVGNYNAIVRHPTLGTEKNVKFDIEENKNFTLE